MDYLLVEENNFNYSNASAQNTETFEAYGPITIAGNFVLFGVSLIAVLTDSVSLYAVYKGKRMPPYTRLLSISYIASDLLCSLSFAVHQLMMFCFGMQDEFVRLTRYMVPGYFFLVSSCSLVLLAFERIFALMGHLKYVVEFSAVRFFGVVTAICVTNAVLLFGSLVQEVITGCGVDVYECSLYDVTRRSRYILITAIIFYDILLLIANIIIHKFVWYHSKRIAAQKASVFKGTQCVGGEHELIKIVGNIILSYFIMHIPISASVFMLEWLNHIKDTPIMRVVRCFAYLCMQISTFVHMYVYIGKLKENKYLIYVLLSKVFKKFIYKADSLKMEVYNIPVAMSDKGLSGSVSA